MPDHLLNGDADAEVMGAWLALEGDDFDQLAGAVKKNNKKTKDR